MSSQLKRVFKCVRSFVYEQAYLKYTNTREFLRRQYIRKISQLVTFTKKYGLNPDLLIHKDNVYIKTNDNFWIYYNIQKNNKTKGDGQNRDFFYDQETQLPERILKCLIPENGVYMDIGANSGYFFTLKIARDIPNVRVYAFEASSDVWDHLQKNIEINQLKNVSAYKKAIADHTGNITISAGRGASNSLLNNDDQNSSGEQVPCTSLDDFMQREQLKRIDAIKVDIEGAEGLFLEGAENTIKTLKPAFIMELNESLLSHHGSSIGKIKDTLKQHGYSFYQIPGSNDFTILQDTHIKTLQNRENDIDTIFREAA